jgi:ribonuclease HII
MEAGCDEAGRGCLAGPVVAAAVILPEEFNDPVLNDSKLLSKDHRNRLRIKIESDAIGYGIGIVDNEEIDRINILRASIKAMHLALDQVKIVPDIILVDGNKFSAYKNIEHKCIVRGDSIFRSIAAASILAKTYRDELMHNYAIEFPEYHWESNVGYATLRHREAIKKFGVTRYHRKTFRQLPGQMDLFNSPR